jgi:hypothetical protein
LGLRELCLEARDTADVLIEGFRPRWSGWGQEGPLATVAGHDINSIAITGALAAIGKPGEPAIPPLSLVGMTLPVARDLAQDKIRVMTIARHLPDAMLNGEMIRLDGAIRMAPR